MRHLLVGFACTVVSITACFPSLRPSQDPEGANSGLSSIVLPSIDEVNKVEFSGKRAESARLFIFKSGISRTYVKKRDCLTSGDILSLGVEGFCSLRISKSGGEASLASKIKLKKGEGYVFALQVYSDASSNVELAKTELLKAKSPDFPCGYYEIAKAENDEYQVGVPVCRDGAKVLVGGVSSVAVSIETPQSKIPVAPATPAKPQPPATTGTPTKTVTCKCTKTLESECKFSLTALFSSTAEWCSALPGKVFTVSQATTNALYTMGKIENFNDMIRVCNSIESKSKAQNGPIYLSPSFFECK
ncbi:MAG: hypothetical protein WCI18_14290 [Pseudomonadota bacterium]